MILDRASQENNNNNIAIKLGQLGHHSFCQKLNHGCQFSSVQLRRSVCTLRNCSLTGMRQCVQCS